MSKIIVDQIQAPNSPPINVPATSVNKYITHTTNGTLADFTEPRTRETIYNYADTGTGVSHVDFSLYNGIKKLRYLKVHGSYPYAAIDATPSGVFRMDFLNSSDATVITAGSVSLFADKYYNSAGGYRAVLTSENNFGIYCHDIPSSDFIFEGTILFNSTNTNFYASFLQIGKNASSAADQIADAEGTITAFPDKLRFYFNSSNSTGAKLVVTPVYEA